mgnify:CR=1 FL=1
MRKFQCASLLYLRKEEAAASMVPEVESQPGMVSADTLDKAAVQQAMIVFVQRFEGLDPTERKARIADARRSLTGDRDLLKGYSYTDTHPGVLQLNAELHALQRVEQGT